jgi:hypothetical protein
MSRILISLQIPTPFYMVGRIGFSQLLNARNTTYVRQREVHTVVPLVPSPRCLEVVITIEKFKSINRHPVASRCLGSCSRLETGWNTSTVALRIVRKATRGIQCLEYNWTTLLLSDGSLVLHVGGGVEGGR